MVGYTIKFNQTCEPLVCRLAALSLNRYWYVRKKSNTDAIKNKLAQIGKAHLCWFRL